MQKPRPQSTTPATTATTANRQAFAKVGIFRWMDLLLHFPLRYDDWHGASMVKSLRDNETAIVEGEITDARETYGRGGRNLLIALGDDKGDTIALRFFRQTPALENALRIGRKIRARGLVRMTRNGWEMAHPKLQSANAPERAVAVYPAIGKMPQLTIRQYVHRALEMFDGAETVDETLRGFGGGEWTTKDALTFIHQPPPGKAHLATDREHPAWRRLRFDELLAHQIVLRRRYHRRIRQTATAIPMPNVADKLYAHLPFAPTAAQHKAIDEVCTDMAKTTPMRRLLQGDVGSGKTLVAAVACLACALHGRTAAFMAPTSILARQHFDTLGEWFAAANIRCELFSAEVRGKHRREAQSRLRFGFSHIAVGTHALFQENVKLPNLALAVADEQHRFGVEQRLALADKGGGAHQLMMSATPIPRTLAMGVFADLDISVLDEKPPGRAKVSTTLIPASRRAEVLARIAARMEQGGRAFWICPRISESPGDDKDDKYGKDGDDGTNAKAEKAQLANAESVAKEARALYPQLQPQVVHGRTPAAEKNAALEGFRTGKTALLVATTVVEVGVDVPAADVMVIENAGRLGLSQLHQLRGRVGRGGKSGYCVLLYDEKLSAAAKERLKILRDSDDGFAIARRDLQLRGPGEWLGLRQSGMPMLKAAKLIEAEDIRKAARNAADTMLSSNIRAAITHTRRWLGKTAKLSRA